MVIYNVTVKIDLSVHDEWLHWMRTHHVPRVLDTGLFNKCRISRLDIEESDGVSYVLQYEANNHKDLNVYMAQYAPALQKEHIEKYSSKFVAFRTYLNVVEELYPTGRKS